VADQIVARSARLHRNLDLRLFVSGCQDRLQWKNGSAKTDWRALLESRMRERPLPAKGEFVGRARTKAQEHAIIRSTAGLPPRERLSAWKKETGKSQAAYYRRLNEVDSHFSPSPPT
jgi:hypothetical protein